MNRRACSTSDEDLGFFFDPHHAPLAATARGLANTWENGAPHDAAVIAESLAGRGLLSACVPRSYGGLVDVAGEGLDVRALCLVREALSWSDGLADTVDPAAQHTPDTDTDTAAATPPPLPAALH
jgi:hypothetical protein